MTHEWTFQKKVSAGFVVMVCLAALTAAVAVYALRAVASKDRVMSVNGQNLIGAARLDSAVEQEVADFRGFLLAGDERMIERRKTAHRSGGSRRSGKAVRCGGRRNPQVGGTGGQLHQGDSWTGGRNSVRRQRHRPGH